jgi:hypothetical protein
MVIVKKKYGQEKTLVDPLLRDTPSTLLFGLLGLPIP